MTVWLSVLVAVFAWWFFTGVILAAVRWADRHGREAHQGVVFGSVPILALGVAGVVLSVPDASENAVYLGFASALAIWGWIELAFLSGVLTGPVRRACPPDARPSERFILACGTVAHHEVTLTLAMCGLMLASIGAENTTAVWTFGVLYVARIMAKLNLFFGVPRINTEFVPQSIGHIKSYFRVGPITPVFPLAIALLTIFTAVFAHRLLDAEAAMLPHYALLTTLAGLALLEHWLMVLPLPDAKLWRWMLPSPSTKDQ